MDIVGVWRFKMLTVFDETIYADASIMECCTDEFLIGVDFLRAHAAVMEFDRNELRYRENT